MNDFSEGRADGIRPCSDCCVFPSEQSSSAPVRNQETASEYGLSLADVYAALAYYYDHREDIDQAMGADEDFIGEMRKRIPSKLRTKLGE